MEISNKRVIRKGDILKLLRSRQAVPLTRPEIRRHFGISGRAVGELHDLLDRMEQRGEIVQVKGDRYAVPRDLDLVVGRLEVNPRGFGFVTPEERGDDIYIHAEEMGTALHDDLVLVRMHPEKRRRRGRGLSGTVVRVLKRGMERIVGTLVKTGNIICVVPDNPALVHDIFVAPSLTGGARPGQKVTVRIVNWDSPHLNPEGEVLEVLGDAGVPAVDTISVIRQFNLRDEFPAEALEECGAVPSDIKTGDLAGRDDLRGKVTFTVDPEDARDFDDAVSLERTPEGNWLLGVHIADVSHYVGAGSAVDAEARERGTSVYFPALVLHMLPPPLSTGICSLKPGEDRLTQSVFLAFDARGKRLGYRMLPSVIRSRRRFTYGEVKAIAIEKVPEARERDRELVPILDEMVRLAEALRRQRFARGAIDLSLPEEKIVFDQEGKIARVDLEEADLAHNLIEEFMLAANEAVAEFLTARKAPLVYRVHDRPAEKDLREFSEIVGAFGFRVKNPNDRRQIQAFLDEVKGLPLGQILHTAYLRSLKRAEYSHQNLGHFGLASRCYTYFTSPIRRYIDLYNHRLVKAILAGEKPSGGKDEEALARHCTETERAAEEAEREMVLLRKLQFFAQQLEGEAGEVFEGVITGVKNFGMFVYLNRYLIEGLVHVSGLTDDFYRLEPSGSALQGRRRGRRYRLGDVIRVRVGKVDLNKKQVDFSIFPSEKSK